jgi:hypothetical protein
MSGRASPRVPWRRLIQAAVAVVLLLGLANVAAALVLGRMRAGAGPGEEDSPLRLETLADGRTCRLSVGRCARAELPCQPSPGGLRLAVVGESFAQGVPYGCDIRSGELGEAGQRHGGPGDWLEALLSRGWPGTPVEVINLGVAGTTSRQLPWLLPVLEHLRPDVVVILSGNNDFPMSSGPSARLLDELPLYALLRKVVPPLRVHRSGQDQGWGPSQRALDDSLEGWRSNLERFVAAVREQGSEVVLVSLPINMRWDGRIGSDIELENMPEDLPFALPWPFVAERLLGLPLEESCDEAGLGPEQRALLEERPCVALARAAVCAEASGDPQASLAGWSGLQDRCPTMNARPSNNRVLRELASGGEGLRLADAEARFLAAGPPGRPDRELFWDHCHMTWRGYHLVASSVLDTLRGAGLVPGSPADPVPDEGAAALVEAMGWRGLEGHAWPVRAPPAP